jgi:hypothetical protein
MAQGPSPAPAPAQPAGSGEDLADIAGPVPIEPVSEFPWAWIALAGVGLLVLAAILILLWDRKRKTRRRANPVERARYHLHKAEKEYLEAEDCYHFSIRLADILRDYVLATTGLAMSRRTSPEFLQLLRQDNQIPEDAKETIRQFLERGDAFKFAHIEGTREDNAWLLEQARLFVKQTATAQRAADDETATPGSGPGSNQEPRNTAEKAEPAHA